MKAANFCNFDSSYSLSVKVYEISDWKVLNTLCLHNRFDNETITFRVRDGF